MKCITARSVIKKVYMRKTLLAFEEVREYSSINAVKKGSQIYNLLLIRQNNSFYNFTDFNGHCNYILIFAQI